MNPAPIITGRDFCIRKGMDYDFIEELGALLGFNTS